MTENNALSREVIFRPGFDKRSNNPSRDYGVHGMDIVFLMRGPKGAVQFVMGTDWFPGEAIVKEFRQRDPLPSLPYQAMPRDLGCHAYSPQYEGQEPMGRDCWALDDPAAECYYDGSSLRAETLYWAFVRDGDAAVWSALQAEYDRLIGPEDTPHG